MIAFKEIFDTLNPKQQEAVVTTEGPVMVLAGPGTGKTQLLSARTANILRVTDTSPHNILCLTFTEAAALNMRQRLSSMIGEQAYDVQIGTYHGFASEIITTYPDYFTQLNLETGEDSRLERPIDAITQLEILSDIIASLAYGDPLYNARYYVKSIAAAISDCKQAALSPSDLQAIASKNLETIAALKDPINGAFAGVGTMPRSYAKAAPLFTEVHTALLGRDDTLTKQALQQLEDALTESESQQSTKPLTAWKNTWLSKADDDSWNFTNLGQSEKLLSLSRIYEQYQAVLSKQSMYDFNDMILRTIEALEQKDELRYTLQERYQYIMLDEFQDTNAAQFKLVTLLADHPVHEGRPNVMAVGDDDQGIFAFQGADIGNMIAFTEAFRDVVSINLTENYRSHADVLHTAHAVASQITSRLHHNLEGIDKTINAASNELPDTAAIVRHEFSSQASEYGWIADQIQMLVQSGTNPNEISVIAPKHRMLEMMVPFLNSRGIPVTYEKRENVFDAPIISGLLLTAKTIITAAAMQHDTLNELLPQVLSLPHFGIPTTAIWETNWQFEQSRYQEKKQWAALALEHEQLAPHVTAILHLGLNAGHTSLEDMLDCMTGAQIISLTGGETYTSPLKNYYFSETAAESSPQQFYEAISHLSVIRSHLREKQQQSEEILKLVDLLKLYDTYVEAEQPLLNTHPIAQAESAVVLQTVYKSKGLEYEHVFLPSLQDDIWGSSVRGNGSKLSFPPNLTHITHGSEDEDTRRRLLFVAITRAKFGLYLTNFALKENGRPSLPAKYLLETSDGTNRISGILPPSTSTVTTIERPHELQQQDIVQLWHDRHTNLTPPLKSLLTPKLARYVMSPTHLNTFTNLEYAGPTAFLLGTLLRFPQAQTADSLYGDALHNCLEWYQKQGIDTGIYPNIPTLFSRLEKRLQTSHLSQADITALVSRGSQALQAYITARASVLQSHGASEVDFRSDGIHLGDARLTGKIDRLEIDESSKTIAIIDFKSGTPAKKWSSESKYINYKQQLYFYILLLQSSRRYKDYTVQSARLEFIEPLSDGSIAAPLVLAFDQTEFDEFKQLIQSVWSRIQLLDLPDTSQYGESPSGTRAFITDLVQNKTAA